MARRKPPVIPDALLNQLLSGADPKSAFDPNGLLYRLKKALNERALNAEMDHHLTSEVEVGNSPNGYGRNTADRQRGAGAGDPPGQLRPGTCQRLWALGQFW